MANTASLLPTIPRIFFVYLEPIMISYGLAMQYATRHSLFSAHPQPPMAALAVPGLSGTYLLSMMLYGLAILLVGPPSKRLLQTHIAILALADFTHWAALFSAMVEADPAGRGWLAVVADTAAWSDDVWALVTYPLGTLAFKFATLAGVFGRIREG
ncbi:hypothetical protein F4778DRAFT_783383 [Xylariomycetidae sp. FL2044]|nr:hypothetical protein F4778DRAFT_783383 [Xylariomycetidae sp. FL2044]